jgi:outer membrane protein assembly factor BamB
MVMRVGPDAHEKSKGWLTAFDAATGKEVWKTAASGGVLSTGDLNDNFLDARSGNHALECHLRFSQNYAIASRAGRGRRREMAR